MYLKNGVLESSWVDFRASRPRFWCLQASILEPPASILKPPGSIVEPPGLQPSFAYASHIQQHHLANVGQSLAWGSFLLCFCLPQQPCQSVGGGGVPPWGPSIRRPPKVCQRRARSHNQRPSTFNKGPTSTFLSRISHYPSL